MRDSSNLEMFMNVDRSISDDKRMEFAGKEQDLEAIEMEFLDQ